MPENTTQELDQATVDLLDVVRRKTLCIPEMAGYSSEIPANRLFGMELRSILCLIRLFAKTNANQETSITSKYPEYMVSRAAGLLSRWPLNFVSLLGEISAEDLPGAPIILNRGRIGGLYKALEFGFSRKGDGAFISNILVEFAKNRINRGPQDIKDFVREKPFSDRFLTAQQFGRRYHILVNKIDEALTEGNFNTVSVKRQFMRRRYVEIDQIAPVDEGGGKIISVPAVATKIGICGPILRRLRSSGHFDTHTRPTWVSGFYEEDVAKFFLKIRSLQRPDMPKRYMAKSHIYLKTILRSSGLDVETKTIVVRRILDKVIPVLGCKGEGIYDVFVGRHAVLEIFREAVFFSQSKISNDTGPSIGGGRPRTISEAAVFLRCSRSLITVLLRSGLLIGSQFWSTWWISDQSLCQVKEIYTSIGAAAKRYGTATSTILALCRLHEVEIFSRNNQEHALVRAFIKKNDVAVLMNLSTRILQNDAGRAA